MKLYHFTNKERLTILLEAGIAKGDVPVTPSTGFNAPWFTTDPKYENQAWAGLHLDHAFDKQEIRITVEIPDDDPLLKKWSDLLEEGKVEKSWYNILNKTGGGGAERRYFYEGVVSKDNIRCIHFRDALPEPTLHRLMDLSRKYEVPIHADLLPGDIWHRVPGSSKTLPHTKGLWSVGDPSRSDKPLLPLEVPTYIREMAEAVTAWGGDAIDLGVFQRNRESFEERQEDAGRVAALIMKGQWQLWKDKLFTAAMRGMEAFTGTAFDVDIPPEGLVVIPDKDFFAGPEILGQFGFSKESVGHISLSLIQVSCHYIDQATINELQQIIVGPTGEQIRGSNYFKLYMNTPGVYVFVTYIFHEVMGNYGGTPIIRQTQPFKVQSPCSMDNDSCVVKSLIRFTELKITGKEHYHPPRAERRRMEKAREPIWEVKVITLRRYEQHPGRPADSEGRHIDWQYRWVVNWHWRKQWYPSEKTHKVIFIDTYIKGPEDKPLKDPKISIQAVRR